MSEMDEAIDAEFEICAQVATRLQLLAERPGNATNFPGVVQAAMVFIDLVLPVEAPTFRMDERLRQLAAEIAGGIERRAWNTGWASMLGEWDSMAEALRGWVANVEAEAEALKPIPADIRRPVVAAARLAWDAADEAARAPVREFAADMIDAADDPARADELLALTLFARLGDDARAEYLGRVVPDRRDVPRLMEAMKLHRWPKPE